METAVCKTSMEKIQDEALNLDLKAEDSSFSTASTSSVKSENSEISLKGKTSNLSTGGLIQVDPEKGLSSESPKTVESPQKSLSPTLIEHAFKVMKNLFSPDKNRSRPANIPSPITHRSASGSPVNSVYVPNKAEFCTSESGIEIKSIVQSAENSSKEDSSLTHLGVMHNSFNLDPFNNTNDSFFTTTSLIDESFQSAITHLDENVDVLKNNENKENVLNDTRDIDLVDALSDTLDNSEICLENTILINNSLNSGLDKPNSVIGDGKKENTMSQDCVEDGNSNSNGKNLNIEVSKTPLNVSSEKNIENPSLESHQLDLQSENDGREEEDKVNREEKIEVSTSNFIGSEEPIQNLKTEIIPLDESHGENLPSDKPSKFNESFRNKSKEEKKEDSNEYEMQISEEILGADGEMCDGGESFVEKSISTTTVILNAMDSADIDNMLLSLREDDSGTNTSSLTSVEGNDENGSGSMEHEVNTQPDSASIDVVSTSLNGDPSESSLDNDFPSKRPLGRVGTKSEENSPNFPRKNKLNKSIDFVKRRSQSKSPVGKKALGEKLGSRSFGRIFTSKNGEALKHFPGFNPPKDALNVEGVCEVRTTLSSPSLNYEENKIDGLIENFSNLNIEKNNVPDEPDSVSVVSQQSYTILIAGDNNLNRPVINSSENLSNGLSRNILPDEEELSSAVYCGASGVRGEDKTDQVQSNYSSVSAEDVNLLATSKPSALSYDVISDSKLLKSPQNGSTQTFVKPGSLILYPQEAKESSGEDKGGDFNESRDSPFQPKPQPDGEPPELSPVAPLGSQVLFLNEMNQSADKKLKSSTPNKPNQCQKKTESPGPIKLNQTYEKKAGSPAPIKMNQTFDKKQEVMAQNKLNQTYEKKAETTPTVKLNKTYEKKSDCLTGKLSQATPDSPTPHKFNETFDKNPDSPSILSQTFEIIDAGGQHEKNKTFEIKGSPVVGNALNKTFEKDQNLEGISSKISEGIIRPTVTRSPGLTSIAENFVEKTGEGVDLGEVRETLETSFISTTSSNASLLHNVNTTVVFNQEPTIGAQIVEDLSVKVQEMKLMKSAKKEKNVGGWVAGLMPPPPSKAQGPFKDATIFVEQKVPPSVRDERVQCDAELVQLIQEQFSSKDIEKICSVVDDLSFLRLSGQKANEQFESLSAAEFKPLEFKCAALTPQGFDFLNSIKGKPTGRDLSRESLYVKFDPLVQAPNANSLIDFTKEGEALAALEPSPETEPGASVCEQLLAISPEKKPDDIVPPLTPISHKKKEDKAERLKELQNEIYFFRNLYAEREKLNKAKMEEFESQVALLTGQNCMLEDKLKESNEREKSLVKKLKEETQSVNQLKAVMEEYVKMITKLTVELQELKLENAKQVETLISEKDSYVTHLQNTEAAFTDVHAKYEKSKKTILNLKANEAAYKSTIAEKTRLLASFKEKAREAQEATFNEFQKIQEELSESKNEHRQETTRLRALLRKTELKLEAMQETLDHKIKENEQLTAICDELIEGKK